jgi:hypothetical protein
MLLRTICIALCTTGLALTSCAMTTALPSVALDFFSPAPEANPWNRKIENWQARHHLDPAVRGETPSEGSDLAEAYDEFTRSMRRRIAEDAVAWVQTRSRDHYRPDGATDHWATLGEVVETGGDDCDGLDLLTFVLLRRLGFDATEIYRAIIVEDGSGQHHMVTLWFERGRADDPFVLDPTGVVTPKMVRLSSVSDWKPIELFDESAHFAVKHHSAAGLPVASAD